MSTVPQNVKYWDYKEYCIASCTTSADYQILFHNYSQHTLQDNIGCRHILLIVLFFKIIMRVKQMPKASGALSSIQTNYRCLKYRPVLYSEVYHISYGFKIVDEIRDFIGCSPFSNVHCAATVKIRLKSFSNFNASVSTPRIKKYVLNLKPSLLSSGGLE